MQLLNGTRFVVKIDNEYSDPFSIDQEVGQGKILSIKNSKECIDAALSLKALKVELDSSYLDISYVGATTCVDDILITATCTEDPKTLLSIAHEFSKQERYNIHLQKMKVIIHNTKGQALSTPGSWGHPSHPLTVTNSRRYQQICNSLCQ